MSQSRAEHHNMATESSIDSQVSIRFCVGTVNIDSPKCDLKPSLVNCQSDYGQSTSSIINEDNFGQTECESRTNEQHAPGALVGNDSVDRPSEGNAKLDVTDMIDEKMYGTNSDIQTEKNCGDCLKESTCNHMLGGSLTVLGTKRTRKTYEDQQASVHIRFEFLSRESKTKLEELLSNWSKWHAQHCSSSKDSYEALECGEETYFPALQFGTEKTTVSFLMDNQVRKKQRMDCVSLKCDSVPLYNREYAFALTLTDGSTKEDRGLELLNASRCFNCGSYSHSLKECPKPRDNVAVSNARKQLQSKKNNIGSPRVLTRYYQITPRRKYDGLKPGALDTETRELLGLGELDPPPWLNRMRELGFPPGYLDIEDEDQPSGITIYADEESKKETEENVKVDVSETMKKRSVDFPGINASVPENGEQSCWATSQMQPDFNSSTYLSNNSRSNYYPELISREHSYSQRWRSGSTDGLFPGYAQELDSFMSVYSRSSRDLGMDYVRKPGATDGVFAGDNREFDSFMSGRSRSYNDLSFGYNSESGSMDGFSGGYRREFDFVPRHSTSYRDFGPNYNSESGQMDSFSGGYRREFDFIPGYSPSYRDFGPIYSSESCSPFSFSPYSLANSRH